MRSPNLRPRDAAATLLVFLAAAYYGLFEADVRVPELGSARAVAAVVFFLGVAAYATGADQGLFRRGTRAGLVVRAEMIAGTAALVVGLIAIASGSRLMLTLLFALTMALWLIATSRHTFRRYQGRAQRRIARSTTSAHPPADRLEAAPLPRRAGRTL